MLTTSFGQMEILYKEGKRPKIEYLTFTSAGRSHQHPNYESFFVTKGSGKVIRGDETVLVGPGDLVVIPPQTSHWMETDSSEIPLEGLLWYHDCELHLK